MYGNVVDKDLSEILQRFLVKFIRGESLRLYHNEIRGIDAIDWKKYPEALIITNDEIHCEPIDKKLNELGALQDFIS